MALEISSVPSMSGERVVGVFGLRGGPLEDGRPNRRTLSAPQAEVLRHLQGTPQTA
jgi:hypothetical protein